MYRSTKYSEWRTAAIWQTAVQVKGQEIKGRYKAVFQFVRPDKRRRDLDNLLKAAMDVIVTARIVEDDCLCEWLEARWVAEGPQCVILLESLDEGPA
jgi:crossover junction endodeoxyribonuclease RusA